MLRILSIFLTLLLLLSFSACSTLLNVDDRQDVIIMNYASSSLPVIITEKDKKRVLSVPAEISLLNDGTDVVISSHPCVVPPFSKKVEKKFDYLTLGNLVLGVFAPVGFAIDASTGAMWENENLIVLPNGILKPNCLDANSTPPELRIIQDNSKTHFTDGLNPQQNFDKRDLQQKHGVMITYFGGRADVSSSVTDDSGNKQVIANGNEQHQGYQISFNNPTKQSTFYYAFIPHIVQHNITISDFRENLPTVAVQGKATVPYVVTDFYSGQEVDPLDPNRYTIKLDAGGIDLTGGSSWTVACPQDFRCLLDLGVAAGITLAEYQHIDLHLGRDRVEENRFRALHAYHGSINGYLIFPDWNNLFVEFGYMMMRYPQIDIPKKVEFKNTAKYNEDKNIFERERVFVDRVELDIATFSFSIGVLF